MKQYLVLSYDLNRLTKEPRILYSGDQEALAKKLTKEYQEDYKGYYIACVEVPLNLE